MLTEPTTILPDGLSSEVSSKKYGSVIDPRMGSDQTGHVCETCFKKVDVGEQFDCPGHLGHIALVRPQVWLLFVPHLIQCLHNVCPFCSCRVAKLQIRREKTSVKSIDGMGEDFMFDDADDPVAVAADDDDAPPDEEEEDEEEGDDDEAGDEVDDEAGDDEVGDEAGGDSDMDDGGDDMDDDDDASEEEDDARVDDDISELFNTDDDLSDDDETEGSVVLSEHEDDDDESAEQQRPVVAPPPTTKSKKSLSTGADPLPLSLPKTSSKPPGAAGKKAQQQQTPTVVAARKSTYWKCSCFDAEANVKFRYYARKNPDKSQNDSGVHIEVKVTAKRLNPATGRRVEVVNKFIVPNSFVYKVLSRITPSDWRFMYHSQFKEYRNHPQGTKRPPPYKPTDLMVNFLPVLPPVDRPSKTLDNKKQADYITRLLNQVISRNNWLAKHIKSLDEEAVPKPPRKSKKSESEAATVTNRLRLDGEVSPSTNPFLVAPETFMQHVGPLFGIDKHLNMLCKDLLTLNGVPVGCAESKPVVDLFRGERSLGSAVAALVDKTSKPGVTSRNLAQRAQGKDGRFRGTLMGKRVNFSARTVITPNPNIDVDEVSIPYAFARSLTVPVKVTSLNLELVRSWVRKGDVRLIVHEHDSGENRRIWCDAEQMKPEILELNARENVFVGAVVHRFLVDGDIVVMNRQPTLHKPSMQGHRVRIEKPVQKNVKYIFGNVVHKRPQKSDAVLMDGFSTAKDDLSIGLNLSVTRPYNADFDGDEMNLHVPQTLEAQAEVRTLMSVKQQLGSRFIGIVQDTLMGAYLMSKADVFFDEEAATWIYAHAAFRYDHLPQLPPPAILKPKRMWTGRQLLNLVLHATPISHNADANLFGTSEPDLVIVRGEFIAGQIRKPHFGEGGYVFSTVFINYGAEKAANVINYFQALVKPYVLRRGISVGIQDCVPSEAVRAKLESWRAGIDERVAAVNPKDEGAVQTLLQKLRTEMASIVISGTKKNRIREMATAGSKGSDNNLVQIQGALAQQIVQGRRPFGDEAARVFTVDPLEGNEFNVTSRGFVKNSLVDGITPREYFCHATGGREGIIDTGCKTALAGYSTRKMSCVTEGAVSNYVGGVTNQAVLQSVLTAPMYADGVSVSMLLRHYIDVHKTSKLQDLLAGVQATSALKLKMLAALKQDRAFVQDVCVQRQDAGELFWLPVDLQHVFDLAARSTGDAGPVVTGEVIFKELFVYKPERFVAYRPNTTSVTRELNKNATRLLRVSVRNFVLRKFAKGNALTHAQFYKFLEILEDRFQRSLVQPGEPVGLEATQTLMQSTMQATLNTFHTAGTGAGAAATGGLNYFNALISAQSPKIASTYVEYDPAFEWSILDAVAPDVKVSNVVTKIIERRGIGLPDTRIRRMHPVDCVAVEFWTPREVLFKKRVTPMQVFMAIGRRIGHCYVELTANGLRVYCPKALYTRALVDELLSVVVTSPKLTPRGKDKNFRGVFAARRVKTERLERKPDGTLGKVDVRQIEIYGNFKLADLFKLPGVDCRKTWCNDLYELQNTLGTGAARAFLQAEILRTVTGSGSNVNPRFVSQIVDYMVWSGSIKPVTRHGMQNFGPLQAAAFEMPVKVISNAALANRVDPMLSPTSNIIFGQEIRGIGTAITDAIPIEVESMQSGVETSSSLDELVDLFDNLDAFARPIVIASTSPPTTTAVVSTGNDVLFDEAVPFLFV